MSTAKVVAIFIPTLFAIVLPFVLSDERSKAAEAKARARRMVDHKMNARLLRFNL